MHQTPKIKKIIGELHKASRTHKGQAERLEKILKVIQNVDKRKRKMADKAIEPGKKSTERYLPKAAWAAMSKAERKKTDDKKKRESRKGKQFVENTKKARKARKDGKQKSC